MEQIVNPKGEMKGSAITGPVGKEAAELWPVRLYSCGHGNMRTDNNAAYCQQLRCCDVSGFYGRSVLAFPAHSSSVGT